MYVRWSGILSHGFHVTNGVRQGGILSPYLFNVGLYMDDLSIALSACCTGCCVSNTIIIMFKICTYMFKAIHGLGPEYINCFVERYMPVRALRSSCNGISLKVTVPRKTIGQSSFSVAGPQMWNDLPIDVRSAQSLMMFRKHLKTYLFRRHYLA